MLDVDTRAQADGEQKERDVKREVTWHAFSGPITRALGAVSICVYLLNVLRGLFVVRCSLNRLVFRI